MSDRASHLDVIFPSPQRPTPALAAAARTFARAKSALHAAQTALAAPDHALAQAFEAAVSRLYATSGRIVVAGIGKSGHVGRKVAATLAATASPALFLHPSEASHGDLGMIGVEDTLLAFSWSGDTGELLDLLAHAKTNRIGVVAITSKRDSTLGRAADVCLVLPAVEEACLDGLVPTSSTTLMLVIGDALASALVDARGVSARDVGHLHPGGRIGARLMPVRALMHAGDAMPLVPEATRMSDAIVEMSSKGFGCVGILDGSGRLVGIVTDGDLRRHMRDDLMAAPVDTVMTRKPATTAPDTLALEALAVLNARRITALFVTDVDTRPSGIVHVHDLLRIGAA